WWMIADQRAATITVRDHQYVRILDLVAALETRRYGAAGRLLLDVTDPLGFAGGAFVIEVDADGVGRVTPVDRDAAPDAALAVRLGITELSAVYLGGVSLATLHRAGRVITDDPVAAARVFSWHTPPRLSIWY
ncbi:sterol carrier protein domain-containing protein, partial [Microbacterium sp.]|uniref:sterol carrier protein domain-containing protein n=1 Tax=Microbacterium sp. TaxID=51671 RepID=UPI002C3B52EC